MRRTTGKLVISFIALFTAVGPYLADWNETHIYNPRWPPHAKFHNGQTMALGTFLGLPAIYCLWFRRGTTEQQKLDEGVVLTSLYWLAQFPAYFFPGTALTDPGGVEMPIVLGIRFNQLVLNIAVIFPSLIANYFLARSSLKKTQD